MKPIAYPIYSLLRVLQIQGNKIFTIEAINFISAPHLSDLDISSNFLTSAKPLAKTMWPILAKINVSSNSFAHIDFGRIKLEKFIGSCICEK
jgi:hypothetical protein